MWSAGPTPSPDLLAQVAALEDRWRPGTAPPGARAPAGCWGAEPYPAGDFMRLLALAMTATEGRVFGDAGAGPGGKVLLAAAMGCLAWGVELVPELAAAARAAGAAVATGSVLDANWAGTHIVYTNQLYRLAPMQVAYERILRGRLAPGTVLVSVNHATAPAAPWWVILDDPGAARGVYLKTDRKADGDRHPGDLDRHQLPADHPGADNPELGR